MEAVFALFLLVLVGAHAKDELQVRDSGGSDAILKIGSVTDLKSEGAVDKDSTLKVVYSASKEAHPLSTDLKLQVQKKIGFWYISIPQIIMDQIGKNVHHPNVKYLGNSVFRSTCLFEDLYGRCFPTKGQHAETVKMTVLLGKMKSLGPVVRWFASGWYKFHVTGTTDKKENAFGVQAEFDVTL